jgi:hypothetical protein
MKYNKESSKAERKCLYKQLKYQAEAKRDAE